MKGNVQCSKFIYTLKIGFRFPQDNGCRVCFGKCLNQSTIYLFVPKQWCVQRQREGQRGRSHIQEGGEVPLLLRMELIFHPLIFADGCKLSNPPSSFNSLHLSHLSGCIRHLSRRRRWDASSAHSALRAVCQRCHGCSSGYPARTSCHLEMFWCLLTEYLWTKCGFSPPALGIPSHGGPFFIIDQSDALYVWMNHSAMKCQKMWGRRKVLRLDSRLCSVPLNDGP